MSNKTLWERTSVQNLLRHGKSGKFYGRWTIGGKQKWKSLKTEVFTVAKLRLNDEAGKIEALRAGRAAVSAGSGSMADLMALYDERVRSNSDLKPNSVRARISGLVKLRKTWPALEHLKPRMVTPSAVAEWAIGFKAGKGASFKPPGAKKAIGGNSSTSVNRAIDTLKRLMDIAVSAGAIHSNPVSVGAMDGRVGSRKRWGVRSLTYRA